MLNGGFFGCLAAQQWIYSLIWSMWVTPGVEMKTPMLGYAATHSYLIVGRVKQQIEGEVHQISWGTKKPERKPRAGMTLSGWYWPVKGADSTPNAMQLLEELLQLIEAIREWSKAVLCGVILPGVSQNKGPLNHPIFTICGNKPSIFWVPYFDKPPYGFYCSSLAGTPWRISPFQGGLMVLNIFYRGL